MGTFYLKTKKSKEVIIKTECHSIEEAINYFSKIKQLPKKDLVSIFIITESEK
jgi:predicted GIY-YIG superfamily endonuclease